MFIKNIRIKGGIHNKFKHYASNDIDEKVLERITQKLMDVLHQEQMNEAWLEIEYTKSIGGKIHS
jgi:hypothetical protein